MHGANIIMNVCEPCGHTLIVAGLVAKTSWTWNQAVGQTFIFDNVVSVCIYVVPDRYIIASTMQPSKYECMLNVYLKIEPLFLHDAFSYLQ